MTLWTVAHQAPLSTGFSSQENWSGLPCPPPEDLPDPGIKPMTSASPALQADSLPTQPPGKPRNTKSESESEVAQSCLSLCDPMDCSLPGSSYQRSLVDIFQARILEWVAMPSSRGLSQPRFPALQADSLSSEPPGTVIIFNTHITPLEMSHKTTAPNLGLTGA